MDNKELNGMGKTSFRIADYLKNNFQMDTNCKEEVEVVLENVKLHDFDCMTTHQDVVKSVNDTAVNYAMGNALEKIKINTIKSYEIIFNVEKESFQIKLIGDIRNLRIIDWNEYEYIIDTIAESINDQIAEYELDRKDVVIVGIERGGLIPMVSLSHRLNLNTSVIKCQTRDNETGEFLKQYAELKDKTLFVVDDVIETGLTKSLIETETQIAKNVFFEFLADLTNDKNNTWIVFPWEGELK